MEFTNTCDNISHIHYGYQTSRLRFEIFEMSDTGWRSWKPSRSQRTRARQNSTGLAWTMLCRL